MRKFLIRFFAVSGAVLVFMVLYGAFCDRFFSDKRFLDHVSNKRAWVLKQENKNYDYAILGSSRAFEGFNMLQLDSMLNCKGVNIAANGSGLLDNYLMFYLFLNNNNHVKHLFINLDSYALASSVDRTFHVYNFLPHWSDPVIRTTISELISPVERSLYSYAPFLRYFKYNKYYSPKEVVRRYYFKDVRVSPFDFYGGGPPANFDAGTGYRDFQGVPEPPQASAFNIESLEKIIGLCRKKGILVTAFRVPEHHVYAAKRYKQGMSLYYREVAIMLRALSIDYLNSWGDLDSRQDYFKDPIHLNALGRVKFTERFFSELLLKEPGSQRFAKMGTRP